MLQYGKGNFLRTFLDVYFDTLNKNGQVKEAGMSAMNALENDLIAVTALSASGC